MISKKVAVCSRTFSKHQVLRAETLALFSNVKFNDDGLALSEESLVNFLEDCVGCIIALEPMQRDVLAKLPALKFLSKYGVGLDNLDLEAINDYSVHLGHTAGVNRRSVSELALALILNCLRKISLHDREVKQGNWKNKGGQTLSGKNIGIIGFGRIGQDFAKIVKGFGTSIQVYDTEDKELEAKALDCKATSLPELLESSDIITLHVPFQPSTHNLIAENELNLMKKNAILINTSRGGVVDETALFQALKLEKIAAAASDVFVNEPLNATSPLLQLDNFTATPHIGGSSDESILAMGRAAISNLKHLFEES